jgi:hypothetical protein
MDCKSILMGLMGILMFASCEKAVNFDLEEVPPKLVVEATIENDQPPRVILTSSVNYFVAISPELLSKSFVHDASVFISNGTSTHQLKEYSVPLTADYSLFYYSIDSSDLATAFEGELNHSYTLRIVHNNKEFTAQTTIPAINKQIDSVWWKPAPPNVDSSKVIVMVKATDPKGYGDYVRYFTKRNNEPFFPGINSVFDDLFVDGTTYELQVEPGWNRNIEREEEDVFFLKGDTVTLRLSGVDKATYDFWRTMEYSYASVGNPFSTPIKVVSNISNGALGYFGGYASQYRTLVIPE